MNVQTIDLNFMGVKDAIASFLIETSLGPILIECGPHSTLPALQKGIEKAGHVWTDIKHVFLTHIHFDHAGSAWAFAENGAKIYVHPRGEKHLANPERLVASAQRIYGDQMDRLWGQLKSIEPNLIQTLNHGEQINIGNTLVKGWYTPGHAVHHIAYEIKKVVFTGDVGGVKTLNGPVVPPCPPPDINIEDWMDSIDLIQSLTPEKLYLTHYGEVSNVEDHLVQLKEILRSWANWIKDAKGLYGSADEIVPVFQKYVAQFLSECGLDQSQIITYEAANPSATAVAGLLRYWDKKESGTSV